MYPLSLHIFRRDLRLQDNTALIQALRQSKEVIPCFIFDKRQIEHNDYKSEHSLQFMARSLKELDEELKKKGSKLYIFYGTAESILIDIIQKIPIKGLFINRDYTPFSTARDQKLKAICETANIDFQIYADTLLHEPEDVLKSDDQPYHIFTPFYHKASQLTVANPQKNPFNPFNHFYKKSISFEDRNFFYKLLSLQNQKLCVKGGRSEGIALLKNIKKLKDYENNRNFPGMHSTTLLSAHIKFGTLSIREVYSEIVKQFGGHHTLIKELYWRDFFTYIVFHYPKVLGEPFQKKYQRMTWNFNPKNFKAWCRGETGFPIVDAGMRELNTTGYMHNRVRMITASFLTKDLHIDWRLGEKYFAQQLVDYDPAVNNGNWQWTASTGSDAQPYFRIFNPWLQQQKYDPQCVYIYKWVPELKSISPKIIHHLHQQPRTIENYPPPIINHEVESKKAKTQYQKAIAP